MRIVLVFLFCAIIGFTAAKHLVEIKRDAPLRGSEAFIDKSVQLLQKCFKPGQQTKQCFKEFHSKLNPPSAASPCEKELGGCVSKATQNHNGLTCLDNFVHCLKDKLKDVI
ncbi:uncharacterized protein LOC111322479 [Stylophora pistillata]|uniref:uncharacterized protein LOC111322479 n=1 Tax=Stylophora pistillata TaxID=50429 RepID=UPI000C0490BD|nr:uncharacterized protein LOC111322479 [Stylophora pistillata]